jgi:hypothetical protein
MVRICIVDRIQTLDLISSNMVRICIVDRIQTLDLISSNNVSKS